MRRLYFAGGTVIVGDLVCKALLRHARGLATQGQVGVLDVPVHLEGGVHAIAHVLIGAGSQLLSVPVLTDDPDAPRDGDDRFARELEEATAVLQPQRPDWDDEMGDVAHPSWDR